MSWLGNFVSRFVIKAKAEEDDGDIVDPQEVLRNKCRAKPKCLTLQEKLETCNARVRSRRETTESCAEELYDWFHCVDHCAAHDLFKQLK
ncbi:hypothetical protein ONE63_010709 [Megalurothrips usitatus]|uniref:Cytochrome b-c1 complex subunit 6 n=1 Tax=Megalurothrips usitatus TaxID=439358 RepID=A0AAV7XI64_9NEOP|nr:hypothetical protein ONE63_010709 [Megalurothrips usitatus]KAJ1524186.1 hypothetical protein ONE63_010709 [Megalurothrips usitatus]